MQKKIVAQKFAIKSQCYVLYRYKFNLWRKYLNSEIKYLRHMCNPAFKVHYLYSKCYF